MQTNGVRPFGLELQASLFGKVVLYPFELRAHNSIRFLSKPHWHNNVAVIVVSVFSGPQLGLRV